MIAVFLMIMMVMLVVVVMIAVFLMIMMVMLMVVVIIAVFLMIMMMLMVMRMTADRAYLFFRHQLICQGHRFFHGSQNLLTGNVIPGGRYDRSLGIFLPYQGNCPIQLFLTHLLSSAQDNGSGAFHLIIVKLAKILHIHFYFHGICHGHQTVYSNLTVFRNTFHCPAHI